MHRGKHHLTLLLALALLLACAAPLSPAAAEERHTFVCGDFAYVLLPDGTAEIVGYTGTTEQELALPAQLDGAAVSGIGDSAFAGCRSLTGVTLPAGLRRIGDEAFSCCDSLTELVIPDGVTRIGKKAFQWCTRLTSVTIPDSVASIGDQVFLHADLLTSVIVGRGSYAEKYCRYHDLPYTYPDSADWLND